MPMNCLYPVRIALLLGLVSGLTACGSMSGLGGSSEFQCSAPTGIPCRSVGAVDHAVQTGKLRPNTEPVGEREIRQAPQPSKGTQAPLEGMRMRPALLSAEDAEAGLGAIRTEPTVIRIWIAPYEDADGDLHEASRVYLQIDSGRWLIETNRDRIRREFGPQPARANASAGTAPARAGAADPFAQFARNQLPRQAGQQDGAASVASGVVAGAASGAAGAVAKPIAGAQ